MPLQPTDMDERVTVPQGRGAAGDHAPSKMFSGRDRRSDIFMTGESISSPESARRTRQVDLARIFRR